MPFSRLFRRRRDRNRAETSESSSSSSQSALGNSDLRELHEEDQASQAAEQDTPTLDALEASLAEEPEETRRPARDRAEDVEEETLAEGRTYQVSAEDMAAGGGDATWRKIARDHGMSPEKLVPFNQHIVEVDLGLGPELQHTETTELVAGAEIYIPSAQELVFAECRARAGSYEEALELYGQIQLGPGIALIDKARHRASGRIGEGYGAAGVDGGSFLTPNAQVNGARPARSETHAGETEYRVFWLANFWKCSVFLHDVVFQAGYRPHMNPNNHYLLAGRLQESPLFEEVPVSDARPGDCWQRFGGTRSNESHVAILSSFVDIEELDEGRERWTMDIIGAESDRAAESTRSHDMIAGTNEMTDGRRLRFFRPTQSR